MIRQKASEYLRKEEKKKENTEPAEKCWDFKSIWTFAST